MSRGRKAGAATTSRSAPPAAAPVAAATSAASSPWILNPWKDLLCFVGTPALILPVMLIGERLWSGKNLYALVMAFGALGHHLPGMMRAYGDRALFARFRTRFIVSPIFLVALCVAFGLRDPRLSPIVLITYFWGVWHGLMQTHGFLRIYDAKARSFGSLTVLLDQWMCISWFGAGVFFSTSRLHHILEKFYASGGPAIPFRYVQDLQIAWGILTAVVTLAFLANLVHSWRAGRPPSLVKLGLLVTSLSFWWYANAVVTNMLVGIALFEIFHDVQYLAIVWIFNRKRVESDPNVGRFTRFVFRDRRVLVLFYVGMVFAYGALSLIPKGSSETLNAVFTGILSASALLHFYYDSFIWRVREKQTRAALGLEGGQEVLAQRGGVPRWVPQGLRWATLVVPAMLLALMQSRPSLSQDQAMLALGQAFPYYPAAQSNLAVYRMNTNNPDAAIKVSRHVLALQPHDPDVEARARETLLHALVGAGMQRVQRRRPGEAEPLLREAAQLDPGLPHLLGERAAEFARNGDHERAIDHYRMALLVNPKDPRLHFELARELFAKQAVGAAIGHARRAQDLLPSDPEVRALLGALEASKRQGL